MSGAAITSLQFDPPRKRMTSPRSSVHATDASPSQAVRSPELAVQDPPATAPAAQPSGDADVLARAQAGDHYAFAQLYSLHKRRIYSLCLRMVGNVAEAEDLTQEAFLQLHRKISTFRGDSA